MPKYSTLVFVLLFLMTLCAAPALAQQGLTPVLDSGNVSVSTPSYANGSAQPLSLDTNGNLRVTTTGSGTGTVANPLYVATVSGSYTDRSGSIASGGTAQTIMAANAGRFGFWILNSSSANLYLNDIGGAAQAGGSSLTLVPGQLYELPTNARATAAVSLYGATTGQTFVAREW